MTRTLRVWAQHLLPQRLLCSFIYYAARWRWAPIKNLLIRWFARRYGIDLEEAERADPSSYPTFNAFFTRALKPGARVLAGEEATVVSPVDGVLTQHGRLGSGRMLQAKGMDYALEELLGERGEAASSLLEGCYATLYLAPRHYHRVHIPLTGRVLRTRYLPGRRFSVNVETVAGVRRLLCRNERVACWFDTSWGTMVGVLVGALNVSSISTDWLGEIASGPPRQWLEGGARSYRRGEEIARFNLGSTVVWLFPPGLTWHRRVQIGAEIEMGQAIGMMPRRGPSV